MSAKAEVLYENENLAPPLPETGVTAVEKPRNAYDWNPEQFASQQILSLVRTVFLRDANRCVKQVAFSALAAEINLDPVCEQVARALAAEAGSQVALVDCTLADGKVGVKKKPSRFPPSRNSSSLKSRSQQLSPNLWKLRRTSLSEDDPSSGIHRLSWLAALREQFECSVIVGPPAGLSSEATLLGQITDGLILVIGANSTRKATAKQIIRTLQASQCRILGTVLCDRTFPIPQQIYRRL